MKMKTFSLIITLISILFGQTQPPTDLNGEALKQWLRDNTFSGKHTTLGYTTARVKMYNSIDNKNNTLTGVYSGYQMNWTAGGTGSNPAPINCEHTVPQSFFSEGEPMKSDIHHLFPTYGNWNSTRSNHPFAEIDDNTTAKWMRTDQSQTTIPSTLINEYSEYANSTFEPREDHKGNVARAIFYFYTMYPTQAGEISRVADPNMLYQWHQADPIDSAEQERNTLVEQHQGNRNPFIDFPELIARAYGFGGTTPSVPAAPSNVTLSASASALTISWADVSTETGYKVYRSTDNITFAVVSSPSANTTSYTDNAVTASTTYYYYLSATNAQGESATSVKVSGQLQSTNPTNGGVFFSEYVEGSSNNKAFEVVNLTNRSVNLAEYSVKKQVNGAGDWGADYTLAGTLASGNVYVVANSSATAELKDKANASSSAASLTFNGNDPLGLFHNGTLIDVIGTFNGGSANFAVNVTLRRAASVAQGSITYTAGNWTSHATDDFTGIGSHSASNPQPTPLAFATNPSHSNVAETSATISFASNVTATAVINYGTSSSNLSSNVSLAENTSFAQNLSLAQNTRYYYQVVLTKGSETVTSVMASFTSLQSLPSVPANVSLSTTSSAIDLSWSAATNAESYDLYRSVDNSNFSKLANVTTTTYSDASATANTMYYYHIKSKNARGESAASAVVSGKIITAEPSENYEPNNRFTEAKSITVGETIKSFIQSNGDEDYFVFSTTKAGAINVRLANFSGVDYDLFLYNSSQVELGKGYTTNDPEIVDYTANAAGTFYVRVDGYQSAASTSNDYELTVSFTETAQNQWYYVNQVIESSHNYSNYTNDTKSYSQPGATKVSVHFTRLETETNYDFVYIKDKTGAKTATYHGTQNSFWVTVDGDKLDINLVSDYSVTKWGYHIDQVAYYAPTQLRAKRVNPDNGYFDGTIAHINAEKGFSVDPLAKKESLSVAVEGFGIGQNYPNPLNPETVIPFNLHGAKQGVLKVYDGLGRLVKSYTVSAHETYVKWKGLNASGTKVASGVYFYQLIANGKQSQVRQMILLK